MDGLLGTTEGGKYVVVEDGDIKGIMEMMDKFKAEEKDERSIKVTEIKFERYVFV